MKMWKRIALAVAVVIVLGLVVFAVSLRSDYQRQAETIYFNGNVLTMDDSLPRAQAVLVRDGRVISVGDSESILRQQTPDTVLVDLDGKTMMPGFIDAHSHVDISAFLQSMIDLSGFTHKRNSDVWATLKAAVPDYEKGEWIAGRGLDPILTADLRTPTRKKLDRIAPDNPLVILSQTLHNYWANSAALEAAGITDDTPDPSDASYYGRDKAGRLNGEIVEQAAFEPIKQAYLDATPKKDLLASFAETMRQYAANGNTTVVSAGLTSDQKVMFWLEQNLSAEQPILLGQLLNRVGLFPSREPFPRHYIYVRPEMTELLPDNPDNGDDSFRVLGVKLWYDGSPYVGSAYLSEPYKKSELTLEDMDLEPGHTGEPLISVPELTAAIEKYNAAGWQLIVHAQGDQALDDVARAFESAGRQLDLHPYRDRIEHGVLMRPKQLMRMWDLGVSPSFHINHLYYYGEALEDSILGRQRTDMALPVRSAGLAGIPYSLHADQPMFESKPFHLMYTAITRRSAQGSRYGSDESITVPEALRAMTIDAAWQIRAEDKLGSISPGKYADLVVLDRDPLRTPMPQFRDITVLRTIVNGNEVDLSGSADSPTASPAH